MLEKIEQIAANLRNERGDTEWTNSAGGDVANALLCLETARDTGYRPSGVAR